MKKTAFIVLFSLFSLSSFSGSHADENDGDSINGNLIAEPALNDYVQATRVPGILSAPFDITDADGNAVRQ